MNTTTVTKTLRSRRFLASLSLVAALFPAIGCGVGAADDDEDVATRGDDVNGPDLGVDYAWARPSPESLYAEGYRFVARYASYDTTGKNLSKGEAEELEKAGLDIVMDWEWGAQDSLDGYDTGVSEAKTALAQAEADGMPSDRPIYFSIDFDAQPDQQGAINSYFEGVASVLGLDRTGAYGGYGVISRLFDDGKIKWGWQTYAWSDGEWDHRAQLRQVLNGIGPGGGEDKDQSTVADFGQWGPGTSKPPPPPPPKDVATTGSSVGRNSDGRLEVFARTAGNALDHIWQKTAGGAWSDWSSLGGDLTSDPVVIANEDGRLEAFAQGTDGGLWHIWQKTAGGAWSGWSGLGGKFVSKITAARNADGRLEIFVRASDDAIWHIWQKTAGGAWSDWSSLGGDVDGDAAIGVNKDGRLEIFSRDGKGALEHTWQKTAGGAWSGWSSLGGDVTTNASIGVNEDGRLEAFALDSKGALEHVWQKTAGGGWSDWSSLGGASTSDPTVARDADGRLETFVRGTDDALYHIWQKTPGGAWSGWSKLGGDISGAASVGVNKDGRLEAFVRDPSGAVSHVWQTTPNGSWSGFSSLGGDEDQ